MAVAVKKYFLALGFMVLFAPARAQDEVIELTSELYYDLATYSAEELDALIQEYAERPLIWAECKPTDFHRLPLRDDLKQILIELRQKHPAVRNWNELRRLTNFSRTDLAVLRQFITFDKPKSQRGYFTNYFVLTNLSERPDVGKILLRWRQPFSPGLTIGGLLERDADEPALADHWNFGGTWSSRQQNQQLIFGAYRLQWGNGLLFASNLMSARTTDVIGNVSMRSPRISNYWGSDENLYLFGAALRWQFMTGNAYLFASRHRLDANITDRVVVNYRYDGIHRTSQQPAAKNAVTETQLGAAGTYTRGRSNWGLLVGLLRSAYPIAALDTLPQIFSTSLFHQLCFDGWEINGELLWQSNSSYGLIENLIWSVGGINLVVSLRHYAPELFVPYGAALARLNSPPGNEQGVYSGLSLGLRRNLYCSAYLDYYRALKPTQVASLPATGCDLVSSLNWRLRSKSQLLLTYRQKVRYNSTSQAMAARENSWSARFQILLSERHNLNIKGILATSCPGRAYENAALSASFRNVGRYWEWQIGVTEYQVLSGQTLYLSEAGVPLQYNLTTLSGRGYHYFGVVSFRPVSRVYLAFAWQYVSKGDSGLDQNADILRGNFQLNVGL